MTILSGNAWPPFGAGSFLLQRVRYSKGVGLAPDDRRMKYARALAIPPPATATRQIGRCRHLLPAVIAVASLVGLHGAAGETIEEALIEAYYNNPQILSERANLRAVDEGVPQALAGWRPTVTVTGSDGWQRLENGTTPAGSSQQSFSGSSNTVDVKIAQPLYQGGQTVAKTAAAEDAVQAERMRTVATESSIFFSVAQAYLDVLRDAAVVAIDRENEQALNDMLVANTGRQRLGELTRTDVAQTQARAVAATAQRQTDEGTLGNSRANYVRFVGHPPGTLTPPTLRPAVPATLDQTLKLAATANPNVIAAMFTEASAKDTVGATRGQLLPSLALIGDANRADSTQLRGLVTKSASLIAQLTMPLYEAGSIYSQTRQAIEKVGQAKGLTDDAQRQAVQGAIQGWETLQAARASFASYESATRSDAIALEGLRREQLAGTRTITDVLNAERDLFSDRTSLARVQHDMALAEYTIALQIGVLTALDLGLKVDLYDVQKHYREVRNKWLGLTVAPP
jgi:outer membrane protein